MNRHHSLAVAGVASILIGAVLLAGPAAVVTAQPAPAQGPIISVGIVSFQDESGTGAPPELGQKLAKDLQQKLIAFNDLLPRSVGSGMDSSALRAMSVEQLTAFGKQQGVKYILRGGLLALTAENVGDETRITSRLYAEIISVETGGVASIRAEGVGTQAPSGTGLKWDSLNLADSQSPKSALGEALANSIQQLAAAVHPLITSPAAGEATGPSSAVAQAGNVAVADSDEELQQLVAQAEAHLASGAGSTESLSALSRALEGLKAALTTKASLLEQVKDTAPADQEIAARQQELQAAVAGLMEEVSAAEASGAEVQEPSGEKKNLLSGIDEYMGAALSILQKIQEMRATFRDAAEDSSYAGGDPAYAGTEQGTPVEETTGEISGVITEDGEAVEGVIVTEEESGVSATTDSNGSYFLQGIPAGRLATLVLTKSGKKMAGSQVDLLRGRPALADFDLRAKSAGAASIAPLRIIPATVVVKAAKARGAGTGVLKGSVRDAGGRPVARALVTLQNIALARTNSQGNYVFLNVPSGLHQLTVYKSGMRLKSERVEVSTRKTRELKTAFAAGDSIVKEKARQAVVLRGVGTVLRGAVVDLVRHPIPGARVTLLAHPSGVISVLTDLHGRYELRDLKPGPYRVLAARVGYETSAQNISLNAGTPQLRDFQLRRSSSALAEKLLARQRAGQREGRNKVRLSGSGTQPAGEEKGSPNYPDEKRTTLGRAGGQQLALTMRSGQARGRVTDSKSGRPVSGAVVSVPGRASVTTNREGFYLITDLAPGTYRVLVRKVNFTDGGGTMHVRLKETVTQDFKVTPKPLRLKPGALN